MMHRITRLTTAGVVLLCAAQLNSCQIESRIEPAPPRPSQTGQPAPMPSPAMTSDVRVWCWDMPRGEAMSDPRIIGMVRVLISHYDADPKRTADAVCNEILARDLSSDKICILLQNLGVGGAPGDRGWRWRKDLHQLPALWAHVEDGLQDRTVEQWWRTPWMAHGIADTRQWMQAFIQQYKHRQQAENVPAPSRFHLDTEWFKPGVFLGGHKNWPAIRQDSRFDSEPLISFGGQTLAELYQEAGEPSVDPDEPVWKPVNDDWRCWYQGVAHQVADATMNEAIYKPLREAWPGIVCSNYATSTCYIVSEGASGKKCGSETEQFGDVMAPVLYAPDKWTSPSLKRTQSNWRTLTVNASLTYLGYLRSCSGRPIVPWIHLPGQAHSDGLVTTPGLTQELMERAHQTHDIDEWLIWSDEKTGAALSNWNDLYEAVVTTYGHAN